MSKCNAAERVLLPGSAVLSIMKGKEEQRYLAVSVGAGYKLGFSDPVGFTNKHSQIMQKSYVITGANKGIGLALVKQVLEKAPENFVFLGSRNKKRGEEARSSLGSPLCERVQVLELDVQSDASVKQAVETVSSSGAVVVGLVNNAGGGDFVGRLAPLVDLNYYSVKRVSEGFLPLLAKNQHSRVVNVGSGAGPSFVEECTMELQSQVFLNDQLSLEDLDARVNEWIKAQDAGEEDMRGKFGLPLKDKLSPYGASKALVATATMIYAREHPDVKINSCTPGFIATDLTAPFATKQGKTPEEMGMKTPTQGCAVIMRLLFDEDLPGNGRFYGSDAKRSPLHKYRSPGSEEYRGGESVL